MSVSYKIYKLDGTLQDTRIGTACYNPFYPNLTPYGKIKVYFRELRKEFDEDDDDFDEDNNPKEFDDTEIEKYVIYLNKAGLKVQICDSIDDADKEISDKYFLVDIKKLGELTTKIVLNCIRYIWEYPEYVKGIMHLMQQKGNVSYFNRILLGHYLRGAFLGNNKYISLPGTGHDFLTSNWHKLLSAKEVKSILKNKNHVSVAYAHIPKKERTHNPVNYKDFFNNKEVKLKDLKNYYLKVYNGDKDA